MLDLSDFVACGKSFKFLAGSVFQDWNLVKIIVCRFVCLHLTPFTNMPWLST